jgi:hypothetical protein
VVISAFVLFVAAPSGAQVSQVSGGAFGYQASVSLFGGPAQTKGPAPAVTLPANGSSSPITANEPSGEAQFGPATIFESGRLTVSTQGTTGADGSVTSSATIAAAPDGPGPFLYQEVRSTCEARESGATGSATISGGRLETRYNPDTEEAIASEAVPANPAPNLERTGTLDQIGDSYRIVFNEQVRQAGGITVNAVHLYLLGPTARGDLIIGQTRCGTSSGGSPGTGAPATSAPATTAPRTTVPGSGATGATGSTTGGGGSAGGAANMPDTGVDIGPLVFLGSELVFAGTAAVVWAGRRRAWPRR